MNLGKIELRKLMRTKLREADGNELRSKSASIRQRLMAWKPFQEASYLHTYCSMPVEVDTRAIIQALLARGCHVFCPKIDQGNMTSHPLGDWNELHLSPGGILEPGTPPASMTTFNLILVPGLAFDIKGGRLGRGRAYYDKFLQTCGGFRLALAFDFQIVESVPLESHDQLVDGILTESRFITVSHCA